MNTIYLPYTFMMVVFVMQSIFNMYFWRSFQEDTSRLSLTYAVNSASDISTEYLLDFSEETPYGNTFIDPNTVWYIYKYTMLKSLNLYSKHNMEEMEYFFPTVIIVVNDGYFTRLMTVESRDVDAPPPFDATDRWVYKFSQKIPFARQPTVATVTSGFVPDATNIIPASSSSYPVMIADTLNGKNIVAFYPRDLGGIGRYVRYQIDGSALPSVEGTAHHIPSINLEILKALDYCMDWNAPRNSVYKQGGVTRIPTEITESLTSDNVTMIGPEVLVIADQFNWVGNSAMSFYTISNTQIINSIPHYCYTVGGIKYYSTADPRVRYGSSTVIEQIYSTQEQCALGGYSPDPHNYD